MRWHRKRQKAEKQDGSALPDEAVAAVLAESAAIVAGQAAALYRREGRPVPAWAWLNSVAHCPPDRLETLAVLGRRTAGDCWAQAVASIVDDLLTMSDSQVEWTQRRLLVGLELAELQGAGRLGRASEVAAAVHRQLGAWRRDQPGQGQRRPGHD